MPSKRVLAMARRLELGKLERRVTRRPGIPGFLICGLLLVAMERIRSIWSLNAWTITFSVSVPVIVAWWAYVWVRRVRGGLYIFKLGFIDAAGLRLIAARWTDIQSITAEEASYSVNSIPAGDTLHYRMVVRIQPQDVVYEHELNTTYADAPEVAGLIARRAKLPNPDAARRQWPSAM